MRDQSLDPLDFPEADFEIISPQSERLTQSQKTVHYDYLEPARTHVFEGSDLRLEAEFVRYDCLTAVAPPPLSHSGP